MSNIIDKIQVSGVTYTISGGSGGGTVSSAITSGDTNAVQGGVLYDELRIPGEVESGLTLEWELYDGGSTINYPSGQCSKIVFENIVRTGGTEGDTWYEPTNGFNFNSSEGDSLGLIGLDVDNDGVITITNATNVTYSIDGNNLTVEYPSIAANVDHIYATNDNYWTTTAFVNVSGMIPLINQVSANTAAISGKADTSAVTAVQDSLSGYVTTDTDQNITGTKTFVGEKKINFKSSDNKNDKLGFTLFNSGGTTDANQTATFEFRPNTYTDSSSVKHPLLYLGHYRKTETANAGVPQTMIGFRQYDQSGAAAYHYLMPLPAEAKTPFSLTTSFKNYFAPLGFKNGDTMITTDNTGVADFSGVLGGMKIAKLSQSEYDNLQNKDSSTIYFIVN